MTKKRKILLIYTPLMIIVDICLLSVITQFMYPQNLTLPNAKLFDQNIGNQKISLVQSTIVDQFEQALLTIQTDNGEETIRLRNLGASVSPEFMTSQLSGYSTRQKLIPFSIFFKQPKVDYYTVGFAAGQSDQLQTIVPKFETPATNAKLVIEDGKINVVDGTNGSKLDFDVALNQIQNTSFNSFSTVVKLEPEVVQPVITKDTVEKAHQKAVDYSAHKIDIVGPTGQIYTLPPEAIIDCLEVKTLPDQNSVDVAINEDRLLKYLKEAGSAFYVASTPSTSTLVDSQQTSLVYGQDGKTVDIDKLKSDIKTALDSPNKNHSIDVSMIPLQPNVVYNRTYSHTQKGLQAYLDYLATTMDVRVSIKQLDGEGWTAAVRQNETTVSASTYKLYVAILVLEKLNIGQLKMSDGILGTTVEDCLNQMLVLSLNGCAEEWISQFGRTNINNYFYARGISTATSFTNPTATHSSTQDLLTVMSGIYTGSLLANPGREILLDHLARQKYRDGIPSGTSGWVQDKVGFLWSYNHDVGVVHTSKGTYILAVMTKNSSFAGIAEITRKIESIMY